MLYLSLPPPTNTSVNSFPPQDTYEDDLKASKRATSVQILMIWSPRSSPNQGTLRCRRVPAVTSPDVSAPCSINARLRCAQGVAPAHIKSDRFCRHVSPEMFKFRCGLKSTRSKLASDKNVILGSMRNFPRRRRNVNILVAILHFYVYMVLPNARKVAKHGV